MNVPQRQQLSVLSAPTLRENGALATLQTPQKRRQQRSVLSTPTFRENTALATLHTSQAPQKRPRVQMRDQEPFDAHLTPQSQKPRTTAAAFSFYAGDLPAVSEEHILPTPDNQKPPVASVTEQHGTENSQAPPRSNSDPVSTLIPGLPFAAADSQPSQPQAPTLNEFDASNSHTEVISLDEDDQLRNFPGLDRNQPSHQNPVTAQSQTIEESEVIDLDDDDALANLQPLPGAKTRLHISRGGGLFREQPSGQLEIIDSDDEEELTHTHRLVGLEDGFHTISNTADPIQQSVIPTVPQQALLPTGHFDDGEQERTPNQSVAPAMEYEPPRLDAPPVTSSFQFSTPTITRWPQSNIYTHMDTISPLQQRPSDASPAANMFLQGFSAGPSNEPLRHQIQSAPFPSSEPALPNDRTEPAGGIAPLSGTPWLMAHSPHPLYANDPFLPAQSFMTPASTVFPTIANPSAIGVSPTQVIHQKVSLTTGNQAHGGSLPAGDEGGISAEGLRNLVKQNGLTADATEEAKTPPELNVSLMPHQKRALHWMAKREVPVDTDEEIAAVDEQCLGGILADDQGLGKTLTMIALLLKNRAKKNEDDEVANKKEDKLERESKPAKSDESIDLEKESNEEDEDEAGLMSDDDNFVAPDRSGDAPWKTLIVCPLSVINQWKEELCSRIKEDFVPRVCVYHGSKRERRLSVLENCDVVITTYATLVTEYPKVLKDHPEFKVRKKEKLPLPTRSGGPICRVSWNRVVLDEAQHVKNRGTDSWSAVMSLKSEKRWCLTGTPIQNSVDDIYSLFCFIRYQFVPNYETWNARWKKKLEHSSAVIRERAFKRFQTIVGVVLLRRTKNDTIKGAPLITLPKRMLEVETPEFCDKEEEVVYRAVQEKSVLTFNKFLVAGTLANNYSSVLLVLLRLRQACSHPFLIEYAGMHNRGRSLSQSTNEVASNRYSTSYSAEDLEEAMELVAGGHSLLSMIDDAARQRVQTALMPPAQGIAPTTRISCQYCQRDTPWYQGSFLACGDMFCPDCCHLLRKEQKCLRCLYNIEDPNVAEVFINADELRKEVHAGVILGEEHGNEVTISASEFKSWFQLEVIRRRTGSSSSTATPDATDGEVDDVNDDDDDALDQLEKSIPEKKTTAAYGRTGRSSSPQSEAKKERLLRALSQHSTKIRKILDKLNEIRKRDSSEKTLIFSQWTSMLDIIEFHVQLEGHEVCRLDGNMTLSNRQKQIDAFRASPTKNVFLISLHAGGTGLNLTAASNVIIADVWWNPAVEEQAIDRAHRIGQTKDVKVTRFKMKGTVEERIYAICAKKREAADGTLGVTGAQSLGRKKLSLQELMYIFGGAAQDVAQSARRGSAAAEAANNILNYQQSTPARLL